MHLTVKRLDSYPILILRGKKKATKWVCSHLSRGRIWIGLWHLRGI